MKKYPVIRALNQDSRAVFGGLMGLSLVCLSVLTGKSTIDTPIMVGISGTDSGSRAEERATDPRQLANALEGDLDVVVMKAMDKDRDRRYVTPSSLADDISRNLREEPAALEFEKWSSPICSRATPV